MASRWVIAAVVLSLLGISGAPTRSLAQAKAPAEAKAPAPDKPQAGPKLLEFPEGTPTEADYWQGWTDFYLEAVKKYEKDSTDSAAIKADIRKLVEQSLALFAARYRNADRSQADWDATVKLSEQIYKRGNRDPLFLHYSSLVLFEQGQLTTARGRLAACRDALDKSGDPYDLRFPTLYQLHRMTRMFGNGSSYRASQKRLAEVLPEWLALADKSPQARRYVWHLVELVYDNFDDFSDDDHGPLLAVYAQQENKDPWLWNMLQGYHEIKIAWRHRGGGYSNSVTEDGWKKLAHHMGLASKHLREAYQLFPQYPEAATHLITVAMAGHEADSEQVWCNRALAAQCDYLPAIEAFSLALWPRWGGSHEAMLLLGEECARSGRYDTRVPYAYVRAIESVNADANLGWKEILKHPDHPDIYDKLHYVMQRLAEHPSRDGKDGELSHEQALYLTKLLGYALHAERLDDAAELTKRLGDKVQPRILMLMGGLKAKFNLSRMYAYEHFGEELVRLQSTAYPEVRGTLEGSRNRQQLMQEMLDRSAVPEARLFFESWVRWMQMEQDFHAGKWVDLTFDPEFNDWNSSNIHLWTYESPRSAIGSTMCPKDIETLGYHLIHFCHFPGPREMECTVEVLSNYSYGNNLGFGFFIGRPRGSTETGMIWVNPVRNAMGASKVYDQKVFSSLYAKSAKVNRLKVKIWGPECYECYGGDNWLNSNKIAQAMHLDDSQDSLRSSVIIGSQWWKGHSTRIRVSDVRVRKLGDRPPDSYQAATDDQATIQYFTKALEEEPEFAWHYIRRGLGYYNAKEYALAAKDLEKGLEVLPDRERVRRILGDTYIKLERYHNGLNALRESFEGTSKKDQPSSDITRTFAFYLAVLPIDELRDGKLALELAQKHCAANKTPSYITFLTLAAAHAETGNFAEALKAIDKALSLTKTDKEQAWVKAYQEKFEAKQPWRYDPKRTEP